MKVSDTRNYGIDLLRFVAMFGIVTLHILNHGGGLNTETDALHSSVVWIIEVAAYPAVNCYALISGFTGYKNQEHQHRYWKYILVYLQVYFYSVVSAMIYVLIVRDYSLTMLLKSMLPVTTKQYWYFTAYTGVFFLEGIINKFIYKLSKEKCQNLFVIIGCLLIYFTFCGQFADPFCVNGGYSFLWLLIMYLVGALIKKLDIGNNTSSVKLLCLGVGLWIVTWGLKMLMGDYCFLLRYTSITIVGMASVWLIIFSKIAVNETFIKYIKSFTPCVFGVYLLHDNNFVRELLISNKFSWIAMQPILAIPLYVLFIGIAVLISCLLIDKMRYGLFSLLRINDLSVRIEHKVSNCIYKLSKRGDRTNDL